MKYDLIIIYAGTGIPDGDLSPRVTGMGKKCPPQAFVRIPAGKFFRRGDGDGEPKPDGEFPVAISICACVGGWGGVGWGSSTRGCVKSRCKVGVVIWTGRRT
jgi:hypothetical protein